jgi:Fe-S oxidoreductase/nitrate reductase gamma subunit
MPDPSVLTYHGVPGYVALWALTVVALGLFGWRAFHFVRLLLSARPERRDDHLAARLRLFVVQVLGQRRLLNEWAIGACHFVIFWAFVVYATGFWWTLARGLFPSLPVPYPDDVRWMAAALDVFGILALGGLAIAAYRRYVVRPDRLEQSPDATRILALIALLLVAYLASSGFKAASPHPGAVRGPAGALLAPVLTWLGAGANTGYVASWWLHLATVLGFLAYLPYSKHLHLLAAPFGVFFGALEPGRLPTGTAGAGELRDLTWRELLSGLSCAECGRCDRACPAVASGSALSPKELMHGVKTLATSVIPPLTAVLTAHRTTYLRATPSHDERPPDLGPALADGGQVVAASAGHPEALVGQAISRDAVWGCSTCLSCMQQCPVFNEHVPVIVDLRRHLVSRGEIDPHVQDALVSLTRYGNSFGQSPRARAKWTQGLGFSIKDVRRTPAEYLWFVGDYASFDPRLQAVTKTTARLLHYAGLDFGILGEGEQNAGNDVRRVGEEGLFETLREKNLKALSKASFDKILTTDPHSYHALRQEYGDGEGLGGRPVLHVTEVLADLVDQGRLPVGRVVVSPTTYHDPCYLGRYHGIYDAPRRLLRALGLILVEMPRSRAHAACCGAGGGRIWMEDGSPVKERPSEARVREASLLQGVHLLAVACPKDFVMFGDAIKTGGLEGRLRVVDVVELVAQAALPDAPLIEWQ